MVMAEMAASYWQVEMPARTESKGVFWKSTSVPNLAAMAFISSISNPVSCLVFSSTTSKGGYEASVATRSLALAPVLAQALSTRLRTTINDNRTNDFCFISSLLRQCKAGNKRYLNNSQGEGVH